MKVLHWLTAVADRTGGFYFLSERERWECRKGNRILSPGVEGSEGGAKVQHGVNRYWLGVVSFSGVSVGERSVVAHSCRRLCQHQYVDRFYLQTWQICSAVSFERTMMSSFQPALLWSTKVVKWRCPVSTTAAVVLSLQQFICVVWRPGFTEASLISRLIPAMFEPRVY